MWKSAWCLLLHKRTNAEKPNQNLSIVFKTTISDPLKSAFLVFAEKPPQNFFLRVSLWFSFKNNRWANVLLVNIFENAIKKTISCQKRHFGCFWRLLTFFSTLKKILIKTTFVRLLFSKLKQKKNVKKYFFKVFVSDS